jgi:NADPH-dependent ferric siderophore reductase
MNIIKQKALSLIENALRKYGTVLAVRGWEPATFFAIDIHFPEMDMSGWQRVQHIKMKVDDGVYRDYTPAEWNSDKRTCTLYADAQHDGPGSRWVRSLRTGDQVVYVGVGNTLHRTTAGDMVVLGDMSALGHYLALQQLADGRPVSGAIALADDGHISQFKNTFKWNVQAVKQRDEGGLLSLLQWANSVDLEGTDVYIAGHIATGIQLRKELRKRKDQPGSIRVQGFWS